MQKSDTSIADASEYWLDLWNETNAEMKMVVKSRCDKSKVFNEFTMTANFLHPVYRGRKLTESQRNQVNGFIFTKLDADGLESCRLFSSNEGIFGQLDRKKVTSPKTYLAMKLLKIPVSTAQLERLFLNWSFVQFQKTY